MARGDSYWYIGSPVDSGKGSVGKVVGGAGSVGTAS